MGHMKLKKIPRKKKFKFIFIIFFIYFIFAYTFYYSFKNNVNDVNTEFINFLLNNGNPFYLSNYKLPKLINSSMNYLLKIDFTNPSSILKENIIGYENTEKDIVNNLEELKKLSFYMEDPNKTIVEDPIIYIYNSHQLENYNNENLGIYGITPNVLMASYLLKEKLNKNNLPTIVEDTNLSDFLKMNHWGFAESYKASRIFMLDKQNTYDSLKYFIDIHRDSVSKKMTSINIKNKDYARIMFVVGLEHPGYQANLDFANKLNDITNSLYPGLSRGVYKKSGPGVNGIYNQDLSKNAILIELGGVDNTIYEVMNTVDAIYNVLSSYINETKK